MNVERPGQVVRTYKPGGASYTVFRVGEVHGRVLEAGGRELFPLYHPAAAMYNQTLKATLFEDARALGATLLDPEFVE